MQYESQGQVDSIRNQQIASICADAENTAKKWAKRTELLVKSAVVTGWLLLLGGAAICWVKGGLVYTNIPAIVLSILGLLQIIDFFTKVINLKERAAKLAGDKVFEKVYKKEVHRRARVAHISLDL